jgi:hypothetical protein
MIIKQAHLPKRGSSSAFKSFPSELTAIFIFESSFFLEFLIIIERFRELAYKKWNEGLDLVSNISFFHLESMKCAKKYDTDKCKDF